MSQEETKKNNSIAIAIIGLIGTIATAVFGSPVLVEWIKSRQATQTPIVITPSPAFTEQVLIFQEDFDNDTVSGFTYKGEWEVGKDKNNRVLESHSAGKATFGPSDFGHGIVEFRVRLGKGGVAELNFRARDGNSYTLQCSEDQLRLGFNENGKFQPFSNETSRALVFEEDAWYLLRVEARGSNIIVFVDNNRILSAIDEQFEQGGLDLQVLSGSAAFDDVKVWELK
ncbi:MAG: hypothetical protein Kow002_04440 [Anaerolineales bacterium]